MIPELEPEEFVAFLADLWRERGWEVSVRERADETHFVLGECGDGKRGVIYVFPTTESTVTERHLKQFVGFCRKRSVDVAVVATQGAFAEGAQRLAAQRSVHLLDRATLASTVEEGGFEGLLREYTETGAIETAIERLRALGVPIPADAAEKASDVSARLAGTAAAVRAKLGIGADGSGDGGGGSGGSGESGDGGDSDALSGAGSGPLGRLRGLASRSIPAAVVPVVLVVAFVIGATVGPAVGLGGPFAPAGDDVAVSAASTAGANATLDVRWNARTTGSLSVNGTAYDAPEGQTFVLVRMNVTNAHEGPTQFDQSALAVEVAGERYGHQPLDGETGFPRAGLFEPGESREVWTVFAVPDDAESATILLTDGTRVRFDRDGSLAPEATVLENDG